MPQAARDFRAARSRAAIARGAVPPAGRLGLEIAVRLDLLRSLGPREAWRRRRQEAAVAELPKEGLRPGYREIWLAAAERLGVQATELPEGFIELRRGERSARVWHSWVPLDDVVTLRFSEHKQLVNARLTQAGLPVTEQLEFRLRESAPALAFLERSEGPCVVKPLSAAGGSGATSGVCTATQLRQALLRAGRLGQRMLIERQVPGHLYRLLFLDGELVDAIRRLPPSVVGNDRSTIAELIAAENERRLSAAAGRRVGLLRLDLDAIFTLERHGRSAGTVPAAGERVPVKTVVNQSGAADTESAREEVGEKLVLEAAAAVAEVGVRLAGVDLITTDPARSLGDTGGAILEVNGTPGLHYHYEIRDRERVVPVAVPILKRLLA